MTARVKYLNKLWSQFQEVGKLLKASESGGLKLDLKQSLKFVKINGFLPLPPRNSKIHPKIHVGSQGTLEAKNSIKRKNILRFFTLLISKLTTKLELSQQYSIGIKTDMKINGIEQRAICSNDF